VPNRRQFLAESAAFTALVLAGCAPAIHTPGRRRFDLIVRGGTVFDGLGADGVERDVGIASGRIAAVAKSLGGDARDLIDARGLAVAPGFIDIHSHADDGLFVDPLAESVIRQGVTTVIVGQDGSSRAPVRAGEAGAPAYRTLREFFAAVDQLPSAVNVASMIGLGTIRHVVVGDDDRPATPEELRRMTALVEAALADGACGASTGLEYVPGEFAPLGELVALSRPLARRHLPYATHMRNEDDRLLQAIDEAIAVARGAGCPLEVSHIKTEGRRNWNKIDEVLRRIGAARASGLDVTFDRYPYIAYQTDLGNLFPSWSKDGGTDAFVARLGRADLQPRLREAVADKIGLLGGWDNVLISSVAADADRGVEGQRMGQYATSIARDPFDAAVALLVRSQGDVGMVGFAMSEANLERFLADPLCTVCSDGGAVSISGPGRVGHPHPRSLGTFARILGHYVRERRVLTLPQAIHKMSAQTAARMRLPERGRIAPAYAADVVVFNPSTVRDRATFEDPFQYADGVSAVIVNGGIALRDGQRGPRTGRSIVLSS
jgi:N-acyl-D-amino-acid deacylase